MPSKATRSTIILFTSAVLLIVVAVAAFQATRGNDAEIAVAAILQDAAAAAANVTSYQEVTSGTQVFDNGDVESGTSVTRINLIEGTVVGMLLDNDGNVGSQTIIVGETIYISVTLDPPTWYAMPNPVSFALDSGMPAGTLLDNMRASLSGITTAGSKVDKGRTVEVIRGQTDLVAKALQLWGDWDSLDSEEQRTKARPREQFLSGEESVELWFDAETNLLLRAIVTGDFPRVGTLPGYHLETTHTFSSYNEPFSISAPPASQIVVAPEPASPLAPVRQSTTP